MLILDRSKTICEILQILIGPNFIVVSQGKISLNDEWRKNIQKFYFITLLSLFLFNTFYLRHASLRKKEEKKEGEKEGRKEK